MQEIWKILAVLFVVALLPACSGDSFSTPTAAAAGTGNGGTAAGCTDPTAPGCTTTAAYLSITASGNGTVKSDGFDTVTITARVLDAGRGAVSKAQVKFSASRGGLSSGVAFTDANGNAEVKYFATQDDPSNGIATVTALVTGLPTASVPITITGSVLSVEPKDGKNTLIVTPPSSTKKLTIKAVNSAGLGIYNSTIALSVALTSGGAAPAGTSLASSTVTTDITGTAEVVLTGVSSGDVVVTASGIGDTATTTINIQDQSAFRISSPSAPAGSFVEMVAGGATQVVTVTAGLSKVPAGSTIGFYTTIGTWTTGSAPGAAITYTTFAATSATDGAATATLSAAATDNGFANVYVFVVGSTTNNDTLNIAMSPPASAAAQIILESEVKTLSPSTATTTYSTKIRAQVLNAKNYPIANATVLLSTANQTGGGEGIAQGIGTTDVYGNFETTFYSGVSSTGQVGVRITAKVESVPTVADTITIEIGGAAGSVALGTPRLLIQSETNNAINTYVMSALVSDGTGAAVPGQNVTLHFWPSEYFTGVWTKTINPVTGQDEFAPLITGRFANEDINENGILDPGEDTNGNGVLDPAPAYAGAAPAVVTTGANGAAPFNFVYLKDAANWVNVRGQASTKVFGTEAVSTMEFVPKSLLSEVNQGNVEDSPFKLWVFVSVADATGTAKLPGTSKNYKLLGSVYSVDKGSFSGTDYYLKASDGPPYVVGNTVAVNVTLNAGTATTPAPGLQYPIYVRFIP